MSVAGLVGSVGALWRYPVKSMMGERVETVIVTERGILGDRAYALVDESTGNLGSAKNPRKWGFLLTCKACFVDPVESEETMPPALIGVIFLGDSTRPGLTAVAALGFALAVVCAVALARFGEAGEERQAHAPAGRADPHDVPARRAALRNSELTEPPMA